MHKESKNASPMMYLTRRAQFAAAHRYHNPALSDEENRRLFGTCNNPYGHGHNYTLEVTVTGEVDPDTGMVMNLTDIDRIVQQEVINRFNHRFINYEIEGFSDKVPTTENLSIYIWKLLEGKFPLGRLYRVRLYEDPELYVDCYGEKEV